MLRGVEPSPASDLYAIGAILFEIIAGRSPYEGAGVDLIVQIRAGAPPRLGVVAPEVSPEIAAIVDRALSADPSARFESAAAFSRALPALATPPRPAPHAGLVASPAAVAIAGAARPFDASPRRVDRRRRRRRRGGDRGRGRRRDRDRARWAAIGGGPHPLAAGAARVDRAARGARAVGGARFVVAAGRHERAARAAGSTSDALPPGRGLPEPRRR